MFSKIIKKVLFLHLIFTLIIIKTQNMNNVSLKNGLIGGFLIIILSLISYLINTPFYLNYFSYISFVLTIYFLYSTGIQVRNNNGGYMSLGLGFKNILLTYMILTLLTTIFVYILYNFIDKSLLETVTNKFMENLEKGLAQQGKEDQAEEMFSFMQKFIPFSSIGITFFYWIINVAIGALISVIIAAIMKRSNPEFNEFA